MAELAESDLEAFSDDRLTGDEAKRMLAAALIVARRFCMWHVSPVKTAHAFTIDGPGSAVLFLPTKKLGTLTSVEEDGDALDLADIVASAGDGTDMMRRVALRKRSGAWWTGEYSGIDLVMTHGFTELEAGDWRQAIMSMVDQMSLVPVQGGTGASTFGQSSLKVDDVTISYANPYMAMAEEVLFSVSHILCEYALPSVEFL